MRILKKTFSMLLVVSMLFSMIPAVSATEGPEISMGMAEVDISNGAASVTVPVKITNNPGFTGMDLSISIPEGWSISEIETRTATEYSIFYALNKYNEMEMQASAEVNVNKNGVGKFLLSSGSKSFAEDGYLFWVTYEVPAKIDSGNYAVEIEPVKINTLEDTTVNIAKDFTFTAGAVTVTGGNEPAPDLSPEIKMGNAEVDLSEGAASVTVPVKITNNPGFTGMDLSISIPEGWSISEIETRTQTEYSIFYALNKYNEMEMQASAEVNVNKNGVGKFLLSSGSKSFAEDGYLFWVTYNVPADTEAGDYKVKVDPVKINTLEDTTVNIAEDFNFIAGKVTVTGAEEPDINYLDMLTATDSDVTINNGLNTEVTVALAATGDMQLYGIEGYWDVEELDGEGYLTLKEITSEVLSLTGGNYGEPATGHVMWMDDTFNPVVLSNGTKVLYATYAVNGDMPAGTYTVRFRSDALIADGFTRMDTVTYYEAKITVARVGDPVETTEITGVVSGVQDGEYINVELYKIGESEDDAATEVIGNNTYTFTKVLPGEYIIKASCNGYEDYVSETLTVTLDGLTHSIPMVKKEVTPPATDGYLDIADKTVTIFNGEDTTVTVALVTKEAMTVIGIQGYWDIGENVMSGEYLHLTDIKSEVLVPSPELGNDYTVEDGYCVWMDNSFAGKTFEAGQEILTATYTVDGNAPEDEYNVGFWTEVLMVKGADSEADVTYTATVTVEHHTHVPGDTVEENRVEATCETDGSYDEVVYCSDSQCGMELSRIGKTIEKLGHNWSEASYSFADDGSACIATRICANDKTHVETVAAKITSEQTKAPTCTELGETTYTAVFDVDWAAEQIKTVADIAALGHDFHIVCARCYETDLDAILNIQAVGGMTYDVQYGVNSRIVTVTNTLACKVGYLNNGAYTIINSQATAQANTYTFAVPSADADVGVVNDILIVVKGDANSDGSFNLLDRAAVAQALLSKRHDMYLPLDVIPTFAADANSDGSFNLLDRAAVAQALLSKRHDMYLPLVW